MKRLLLIFLFFTGWLTGIAQNDTTPKVPVDTPKSSPRIRPARRPVKPLIIADSLKITDTTVLNLKADSLSKDTLVKIDSLPKKVNVVPVKKFEGIDSTYARFLNNPYLPMGKKPVFQVIKRKVRSTKDDLFYIVAGLVSFLAFIRIIFSRYFQNIFRLFFQPSFRQKQTREQLMQSNLPSLMLNLFFIFSLGMYVALLVQYYQLLPLGFWWLYLYCTIALCILYLAKFLFLSFSGWVFNVKEATETYIFVVYLINKILGVLLVPFILVLAFSHSNIVNVAVTISLLLIGLLFLYRYLVSYAPVRKDLRVSPLHFLVYICAFEIIPLLLIYKSLILYLDRTH